MINNPEVIIILGGSLKRDKGVWRTTFLNEGDNFGVLGDRLRVLAGGFLYKNYRASNPDLLILVAGGRGQLGKTPGAPAVAKVLKKELMALGVRGRKILEEKASGNTYQQLRNSQDIVRARALNRVLVVSNKYHLGRVEAFIKYVPRLSFFKKMFDDRRLTLASAESALLKYDPLNWREKIKKAYRSPSMQKRILQEKGGTAKIKKGRYRLE